MLSRTLAVLDTATIDLQLIGSGTAVDPYTLSATYTGTPPTAEDRVSEFQSWGAAVNLSTKTKPVLIRATLTASISSITLPTWASTMAGTITLVLSQDGVGNRTWVMPGTSAGGVDVVLSTAPNARDIIDLRWTGVQWVCVPVAMNVS
jgi:hypothetical protein